MKTKKKVLYSVQNVCNTDHLFIEPLNGRETAPLAQGAPQDLITSIDILWEIEMGHAGAASEGFCALLLGAD